MGLRRLIRSLSSEAHKASAEVRKSVVVLARIHVDTLTESRSAPHRLAMMNLARSLAKLHAAADLSGRLELRSRIPESLEPEAFAAEVADVVPAVAFEDAIRDLLERDPIGASDLRAAGLDVERVYGGIPDGQGGTWHPHGFALAAAADREIAKAVRDRLVESLRKGQSTQDAAKEIVEDWDWPASYAENVVRTNFNTATTAGRFREAERVARLGVPTGFRFTCVLDSNLRQGRPQDHGENHKALDGLVARTDDPIWLRFSPPGGHNCRCTLETVIGGEVPTGFVFTPIGAAFAPGFGSRPDRSGAYR